MGTLQLAALLGAAISAAMLLVGAKLHRRSRLESHAALAWFAAFWIGIGAYGLAEATWVASWLVGLDSFAFALIVLHVKIIGTCVAFAGLVIYVMLVRGAGMRATALVASAYAVVLALVETHYSWRGPIGQEAGTWGLRLVYERPSVEPWWTALLLLLLLPPILAAASYAMLLPHAREPLQRLRIGLVSASLAAFFVPTLLAWKAGGLPWWGLAEKLLGLAMALGVVVAMWPPRRLVALLGARPSRDEADAALLARARMLV